MTPIRVLSLGAGVQSSTLALLIARGEVPMVDCAIFADTQWEMPKTYEWLAWLETQLPFPVHRCTAGDIRANLVRKQNIDGGRFVSVPWFTINKDGSRGMGRRQCTREYKLDPIKRKKRELLGIPKGKRAPLGSSTTLIGISLDEVERMKPARDRWDRNEHPLIDLRMTRLHCLQWMMKHYGRTPPKSACKGCPFHSDEQWAEIKESPADWADVLEMDALIRQPARGMKGQQFMHDERIPLAKVQLDPTRQQNLFINECEGMCGV